MHPAIYVDLGPLGFAISAYRLAMITAAVVAVAGTVFVGIRRGLPARQMIAAGAMGAVGAVAGARILGALNTATPLLELSVGAFSIWGAIVGGSLGIWGAARLNSQPVGRFFDAAAIPAGIAIAVSRGGCWCAGCCFGAPSHAPWAVTYPRGSSAHIANLDSGGSLGDLFAAPPAVHPVPIYDGGAALLAVAAAIFVGRRLVRRGFLPPGSAALALVAVYATARIAIETVRFHVAEPALLGEAGWQAAFAGVALAAGVALWRGARASREGLAAT